MIKLVEQDRNQQINAFGIVDRDILLGRHQWNLWWEANDDTFLSRKPCGDDIRVLLKWELENYLLAIEAMSAIISKGKINPHSGW